VSLILSKLSVIKLQAELAKIATQGSWPDEFSLAKIEKSYSSSVWQFSFFVNFIAMRK